MTLWSKGLIDPKNYNYKYQNFSVQKNYKYKYQNFSVPKNYNYKYQNFSVPKNYNYYKYQNFSVPENYNYKYLNFSVPKNYNYKYQNFSVPRNYNYKFQNFSVPIKITIISTKISLHLRIIGAHISITHLCTYTRTCHQSIPSVHTLQIHLSVCISVYFVTCGYTSEMSQCVPFGRYTDSVFAVN